MRGVILAVGTELLGVDRLDTNSLRLAASLQRYGVSLIGKAVVGDTPADLSARLRAESEIADVLLVTGGLGPTTDDLTREAVAATFGLEMVEDPAIIDDIRTKFRGFGMKMPEVNRRQALVPEGATVLPNPRGTAPGLRLRGGDCTLFLFPGVPRELEVMIPKHLDPWLEKHSKGDVSETVAVRVACRSESAVEESLQPLYERFGAASIGVLASPGDIEVRLTASGSQSDRSTQLAKMLTAAREALGSAVYASNGEPNLETKIGGMLLEVGATVATAESCTGGMVAERLTGVPGSSGYFLGGVVAYSNDVKRALVEVDPQLIENHGAVSEEVAAAMAEGARRQLGADYGIGVTGIAGPGGGSPEKPVGTVHVAVAGPTRVSHRLLTIPGERERVRRMSTQWALEGLRRMLLSDGKGP